MHLLLMTIPLNVEQKVVVIIAVFAKAMQPELASFIFFVLSANYLDKPYYINLPTGLSHPEYTI